MIQLFLKTQNGVKFKFFLFGLTIQRNTSESDTEAKYFFFGWVCEFKVLLKNLQIILVCFIHFFLLILSNWIEMHQIQTALFQGHFVSSNEEIFLYLWVQSRATILPKKRGVFQSLTAAVNILPEMCQKNPNFRSLVCRLERKKKSWTIIIK